jgi:hypothetical protein
MMCLTVFCLHSSLFVQWKEGDEIPESWKDYYWFNPCVPVDFKTVARAFAVARGSSRPAGGQKLRILLRPGKHYLREALTVHMPFNGAVELITMELPVFFEKPAGETTVEPSTIEASEGSSSGTRKRSNSSSFRNLLCRTVEVETQEGEDPSAEFTEIGSPSLAVPPKRATLILRTRRHNEPLIRIRQGTCILRNVELRHISHGIGKKLFMWWINNRPLSFC